MLTRGTENRYGELHQPGYEHSFGRTAPLPPTFAPRHFQRSVCSQRGRKSNSVLSDAATRPSPAPPPPPSRGPAPQPSGPQGRAQLPAPRLDGPKAAPHGWQGRVAQRHRGGTRGGTRRRRGQPDPPATWPREQAEAARPGRETGSWPSSASPCRKNAGRTPQGNRRQGPRARHGAALPERGSRGGRRRGPRRPACRAAAHPLRDPAPARQLPAPRAAAVLVQVSEARRQQRKLRAPALAALTVGDGHEGSAGPSERSKGGRTAPLGRPRRRQAAKNGTIVTSGPRTRAGPRLWPRRLLPEMAPAASRCSQAPHTARGRPVPVAGALARHRARPRASHLSRDSAAGNRRSNARETR